MLSKNQIIPLEIQALTNEGNGVGRHQSMAVFVPMTAPGDRAQVRIVKVLSSYCYGIVEELETPSPLRVDQDCPVYRRCGGCVLRHITYEAELEAKQGWVEDAFRRIGGFANLAAEPILGSNRVEGYRNKAQYPLAQGPEGTYCGFYAPRSHTVVPVQDCRLQPAFFEDICQVVCAYIDRVGGAVYDEASGKGLFRHLYLRWAEATGQVMVCLVVTKGSIPRQQELLDALLAACPQVASICLNVNPRRTNVILGQQTIPLYGPGRIEDILRGVRVSLSPLSFYQVNHHSAEVLYDVAEEFAQLEPHHTLLDLYCGAGTIGLSMAHRVKELIGVEVVSVAVEDAKANAARGGVGNARFLCGDAGQAATQLAREGVRPQVIILDPPRKGCDQATLDAVVEMAPERVVMVSCNPATAARDAKILAEGGYLVQRVKPVDLFPRTKHVETCVLLSHKNPQTSPPSL